jgi:hypothetical protein
VTSKYNKAKYNHTATQEACDTYTDGVFAVLALVNEARWDPGKRELRADVSYGIGRRMTTSGENRVSRQTEVTPDCVVQLGDETGFVTEAKLGLPKEENLWDDDIKQMQKYDDDLAGWWSESERIRQHDVVGLVPLNRAVKFADRLEAGVKGGKWQFVRKVSVVGFFKQSGVKDFMTVKKERGELSLHDLGQRLRESRLIPLDRLIIEYNDRKFVDHPPPLPYLLQVMWDHLFTRYAADATNANSGDSTTLHVNVKKITEDLQSYFGFASTGPHSPEIPRATWVRKALDALVDFKVATPIRDGEYEIAYKSTRHDTLRRFGKLYFQLEQKKRNSSPAQMNLLPPG